LSAIRKLKSQALCLAREKLVWDLNQQACSITRLRIGSRGTTMREIDEDFDAFQDNVVTFFATNVDDETHAAGIVLVRRIVKSLRRRKPVNSALARHQKPGRPFR